MFNFYNDEVKTFCCLIIVYTVKLKIKKMNKNILIGNIITNNDYILVHIYIYFLYQHFIFKFCEKDVNIHNFYIIL